MKPDDEFVTEHAALVRSIALRIKRDLVLDCELDDLIAFGYRGLLEARGRFDAQRGVRFTSFAYYRIRGSIIDGVRAMAALPRRAHAQLKALQTLDAEAEGAARERAGSQETRSSPSAALTVMQRVLSRMACSYAMARTAAGAEAIDESPSPESKLIARDQQAHALRLLSSLPGREQVLMRGFYFEGRSLDEMAQEMGMSRSWASRLHGKALDRMRHSLQAAP
ncbi:MAG: sigma-70 family RNA polymerase sigma factor [Proteobacteria bacterium]|nr:sigma-70 family RNA polymerase sigma factor [Pseudomonadota bacterium]